MHPKRGWRPETARDPLSLWDLLGMMAGLVLCITVTCVLSRGRVFWEDEMLGWMLLTDPSWHHMVNAWKMGADGGGFAFYLTGRAWLGVFGHSELAFRLYSSMCFGLGFAALWAALRRFYPTAIVAFALFNTWFCSAPFILHMREGRFYGLLVVSAALAVWSAVTIADRERPIGAWLWLGSFAAHALLTTSHVLGAVFSAAVLAGLITVDRLRARWRPSVYCSGAAAWLLLIPERDAILNSARVGQPHFWTTAPTIGRFFGVYSGSSGEIAVVIGALLCVVVWTVVRGGKPWNGVLRDALERRMPLYVVGGALLLVPVLFLVEGLLGGTWLLNNRYMLPVAIATAMVTAEALELIRERLPDATLTGLKAAAVVFLGVTLTFWDFHHLRNESPSPLDYTAALAGRLPTDVPVVCEDAFSFTELEGRRHATGVRFTLLLDWKQSTSAAAPRLEVTQYHLMENWRKAGYFSGAIEPIDDFLREHSRFLVLHAALDVPDPPPPEIGNPLVQRFRENAEYEVQPYMRFDRPPMVDTIWLVCRGGCARDAARR